MSLGRRRVGLHEPERWIYNRMAEAYAARPAYPGALVDRLSALAGATSGEREGHEGHILDLGAGLGLLSLPLAARGHEVIAVDPAAAMLQALSLRAQQAQLPIRTLHAAAEALPLPDHSVSLVVIADAVHFLDAQRTGAELARVLAPHAALAFIQVELAGSPFMRELVHIMQEAAPRRPRRVTGTMTQMAALCGVDLREYEAFENDVPMDHARLEQLFGSISFIGPAMNPARLSAFCARVRAIPHAPRWHTHIRLHAGHRASGHNLETAETIRAQRLPP